MRQVHPEISYTYFPRLFVSSVLVFLSFYDCDARTFVCVRETFNNVGFFPSFDADSLYQCWLPNDKLKVNTAVKILHRARRRICVHNAADS